MAATGYTPISLYYSTTAAAQPTAGNLVNGELAINITDGKLYYKDNGGVVQLLASKGGTPPGGATTQVQYNNAGAFAGSANMTFNGTSLTLANDATINGLTVGQGNNSGANTALGIAAISAGGSGIWNTAVGYHAKYTSTGSYETAVGGETLTVSTGNGNVALGYQSLKANTTGANNVGVGQQSLLSNLAGSSNTAIGHQSLNLNTASNNTAVGYQAGYSNTTGANNLCLGYQAGYSNTTGNANTFVGYGAGLSSNYNGTSGNTCVGVTAGYNLTTGIGNTFIGYTPNNISTGSGNGAAYLITTGSYNLVLGGFNGNQGGLDIRTASNYIVLSDGAGNPRVVTNNLGITSIPSTTYAPNINLTDAATIAWDTSLGQVATFTFVSSNRTMGAPTNLVNGGFYALAVIQNGGGNTLTWNSVFKWAGGVAPTLSSTAGAKDYFVFRSDGTNLYQQGASLGVA